MKLSQIISSGLATVALLSSSQAAYFYANFDAPLYNTANWDQLGGPDLHGQNGWTVDAANLPTVGTLPTQLTTFTDFAGLGDTWGTVGGQWSTPNTKNVELSHSAALPLGGSAFSVDLDIVKNDSVYPNRDKFGWSLKGAGAADVMRVAFEPGAPGLMEVVWYNTSGTRFSTGKDIAYDAMYSLKVNFNANNGTDLYFNASITGLNTFNWSGTLAGQANTSIVSINADYDVTSALPSGAGGNYMAFNGVLIPEPSSMLTAGLAFLGLAFRRRR